MRLIGIIVYRLEKLVQPDNMIEKGYGMINFDEEVARFQPSLEIDQAEEAIFNNELADISDMIESILKERKDK